MWIYSMSVYTYLFTVGVNPTYSLIITRWDYLGESERLRGGGGERLTSRPVQLHIII